MFSLSPFYNNFPLNIFRLGGENLAELDSVAKLLARGISSLTARLFAKHRPETGKSREVDFYQGWQLDGTRWVRTKVGSTNESTLVNIKKRIENNGKIYYEATKGDQKGYVLASSLDKLDASAKKVQAIIRGALVRKQVRVQSEGKSIIGTRIRPAEGKYSVTTDNTPLDQIQKLMKPGAEYNRLRILGGAKKTNIIGTKDGQKPENPQQLAEQSNNQAAVINGGYFVHKQGLETDTGRKIREIGKPVGATSTRKDNVPVPKPWKDDYGTINIKDQTALTSGPLLSKNGKLEKLPFDNARFKYRLGDKENDLNRRAGALTHASDANERAGVSIVEKDILMHTLTAQGKRKQGASMSEWQKITQVGSNPHGKNNASTLNLDGGGSVFLGVNDNGRIRMISRGGNPNSDVRPVANIISSEGGSRNDSILAIINRINNKNGK